MTGDTSPTASATVHRRRTSLLLLIIPVVLYLLTPIVANSIEPRVFGLPFVVVYTIIVTILTWFFIWMAARGDAYYHTDHAEYVPVDRAFEGDRFSGERAHIVDEEDQR